MEVPVYVDTEVMLIGTSEVLISSSSAVARLPD